jgi:hypothetical protein
MTKVRGVLGLATVLGLLHEASGVLLPAPASLRAKPGDFCDAHLRCAAATKLGAIARTQASLLSRTCVVAQLVMMCARASASQRVLLSARIAAPRISRSTGR